MRRYDVVLGVEPPAAILFINRGDHEGLSLVGTGVDEVQEASIRMVFDLIMT